MFGGLYSLLGPPGSAHLDGATSADLITGLCPATRVLDSLVHRSTNGDRQQVDTTPTCR